MPSTRTPEQAWNRIAVEHYGFREPRLLSERLHFSRHYHLGCGDRKYVLSRVCKAPGRLPFPLQFKIMSLLRRNGAGLVSTAVPTHDGRAYVDDGDYWFVRTFRVNDNDTAMWRASSALIGEAARALALMHRAGAGDNRALGGVDQTRLAPYYRSVEAFLDTLPQRVTDRAEAAVLPAEDRDLLARTLGELHDTRQKMLGESRDQNLTGITHHDFRPDNLLVRNSRIVEIIDWDCASIDHQLHDVAFAALQFGQRQCLHDADIGLAKVFIGRYLTERGLEHLPAELMWWFLRFTVVKRLLIKGRNHERLRLLRAFADGPIPCAPRDRAAS